MLPMNVLSRILYTMVVIVLVWASKLFAQVPSAPVPANLFGMHIQFTNTAWPDLPFGTEGKSSGVVWPYIEQTKGVFDWSRLDFFVNQATSHGVSYVITAHFVPPWAASNPASCIANYAFGASVCT